jgi:hypothetical protein
VGKYVAGLGATPSADPNYAGFYQYNQPTITDYAKHFLKPYVALNLHEAGGGLRDFAQRLEHVALVRLHCPAIMPLFGGYTYATGEVTTADSTATPAKCGVNIYFHNGTQADLASGSGVAQATARYTDLNCKTADEFVQLFKATAADL